MKIKLLLCLMCFSFVIQAQNTYSYVTDRKFYDPRDLIGYNFRPGAVEIRDEYESELDPGEYSFGITQKNLYVEGGEISGVYTVNNIETTEFGFKLLLMNSRDATMQGHLKVIVNPSQNVEAVVFRKSNKSPEMIFFLNEISDQLNEKESEYFTDIKELKIEDPDSLWTKTVHPFLLIHHGSGIQDRIQITDSTSLVFSRTLRFIDKHAKKKEKQRKKEEKEREKLANEKEMLKDVAVEEDEVVEEVEEISEEEMEKKVRTAKILAFDIGTLKTEEDLEMLDDDIRKDIILKRELQLEIASILKYDDGTVEKKVVSHKIKKVTQREDEAAGPDEERYQLDLETTKGINIYLYLTGDKAISSLEIEDKLFLMRGH